MKRVVKIVAAIAFLPLTGGAQPPRNTATDRLAAVAALEQTIVEAIARVEPSVVAILRSAPQAATFDAFGELRSSRDADNEPVTVASGVIIDPAGLVLTQYLAVREGDQHAVKTIDGKTHRAIIRAADPRSGLAVLAIDASPRPRQPTGRSRAIGAPAPATFDAIRFGDASKLRKGQFVIALGNPFAIEADGEPTASWGIVTNLARKAPANTNFNDAPGVTGDYRTTVHHLGTLIQTDAKLAWSAGGGALVNLQGDLVGLTTTAAVIPGHEQPAGYAIPINAAFRRIIDSLKEGREVEYGMLGISFATGSIQADDKRVTVGEVIPGTPAALAGLQAADVVTRVGDEPIRDVDSIQLAVSMEPPSTETTLEYQRAGRTVTADVRLAKLAVSGKIIATAQPENWHGIRVDYGNGA